MDTERPKSIFSPHFDQFQLYINAPEWTLWVLPTVCFLSKEKSILSGGKFPALFVFISDSHSQQSSTFALDNSLLFSSRVHSCCSFQWFWWKTTDLEHYSFIPHRCYQLLSILFLFFIKQPSFKPISAVHQCHRAGTDFTAFFTIYDSSNLGVIC